MRQEYLTGLKEYLELCRKHSFKLFPLHTEKPDFVFDIPHTHQWLPKTEEEARNLLEALTSRTDLSALGEKNCWQESLLSVKNLINLPYSVLGHYDIEGNDLLRKIHRNGKIVLVYKTQEILTNTGHHITAEGHNDNILDGLTPEETIKRIRRQNGMMVLEHPYTIQRPSPLVFTLATEDEAKHSYDLMPLVDAVEVCNGMNALWMYKSNELAKELLNRFNQENQQNQKPGIGGDDNHGGLDLMGRCGIYQPKEIMKSTPEDFFETRRRFFQDRNLIQRINSGELTHFNVADIKTFFRTMIWPSITWKLGLAH